MFQFTEVSAQRFAEARRYENLSPLALVLFQLSQARLFVPFNIYQKAMEIVLERPVWSHEFGEPSRLMEELFTKLELRSHLRE